LHRCRAWAYKWYKRYNENGLDGLKDKERSGRPPDIPKETIYKIKKS
jgi:putative transposase